MTLKIRNLKSLVYFEWVIDNFGSSDDDINIVKKIMISTRCIVGIWFLDQLVQQILNGL